MSVSYLSNQPIRPKQFQWLFRYRLHHLPFWMLYHYLWWVVAIGSPLEAASSILFSVYSFKFIFYVVFQATGVYFNLYFLIPRYLEKGRYVAYISLLLLTILSTAALIVSGYYVGAFFSERTFEQLYNAAPSSYFQFFKANALPSTVASMTLGMSIKLTKNWLQARGQQQALERRQQQLEKEKLETELKFLKAQFNPHFLFNTINSIFVLIHKNPNSAAESLAKFSELLRYQLYECNEAQIPLERELDYFANFIELEKLRQDHHITLDVKTDLPPSDRLVVAPFILMPFVENAFKHVSQRMDQSNWINIHLSLRDQQLQLDVANSIGSPAEQFTALNSLRGVPNGGLGLKNVRRRLDLLYPEQYRLDIRQDHSQFRVKLHLSLQQQPVPQLLPL